MQPKADFHTKKAHDSNSISEVERNRQSIWQCGRCRHSSHLEYLISLENRKFLFQCQSKKCDLIRSLLVSCDSVEAKFLLRSLSGKLRIGLAEQSALTALAHALTITPPLIEPTDEQVIDFFRENKITQIEMIKKQCEESAKLLKLCYYQCPNYEVVIKAILKYGLDKLDENCKLTPGIPLKPMLAYPTNGISEVLRRFENIEFTCEYKYDGERAQVFVCSKPNYDSSQPVYPIYAQLRSTYSRMEASIFTVEIPRTTQASIPMLYK